MHPLHEYVAKQLAERPQHIKMHSKSRGKAPTPPVEELVQERTSPAVKAALKSLLDAPLASGARRARKGKTDA